MKRFQLFAFFLLAPLNAHAGDVSIGVLGLFHPREIVVAPRAGHVLECSAGGKRWTVTTPLRLRFGAARGKMIVDDNAAPVTAVRCDDGQNGPAEFSVAVPQKISRRYAGKLEVEAQPHELVVAIKMEMEVAVASVVAAESPPEAPMEALKAQAVAVRSFLAAGKGRHRGFDFCDTTHCQFLREPPTPGSPAARAAAETSGMVLAFQDEVFAAMYSASCGGKTHSLEELGIPVRDYPYFAVPCEYCHRHPERWVATLTAEDAAGLKGTESSRLKLARKLGWQTFPSNSYSTHRQGDQVLVKGTGSGHGIGLCQRGAVDMARQGASFQQILEHYYPNTTVKRLP